MEAESAEVKVSLRLSADLHKRLKIQAIVEDLSLQALVNQLLTRAMNEKCP